MSELETAMDARVRQLEEGHASVCRQLHVVQTQLAQKQKDYDCMVENFRVTNASYVKADKEVADAKKERDEARHEYDNARRELVAHREKAQGNYWAWQGNGEDHLESISYSFPVVIGASQLQEIIKQRDTALAELAQFHEAMERERKPDWEQFVKSHADFIDRLATIVDDVLRPSAKEKLQQVSILLNELWQCFTHKANFVPSNLRIKELEAACAAKDEALEFITQRISHVWASGRGLLVGGDIGDILNSYTKGRSAACGEGWKSPEDVERIEGQRTYFLQDNQRLKAELERVCDKNTKLEAEAGAMRKALRAMHTHAQESCEVYFENNGTAVDLGESYAESSLCDKVVSALATSAGQSLLDELERLRWALHDVFELASRQKSNRDCATVDGLINTAMAAVRVIRQVCDESKEERDKRKVRPKTVCICGSSRFCDIAAVESWNFEKQGILALSMHLLPQWYWEGTNKVGRDHGAEQEGVAHILDELHLRRIDLCDFIFVVNKDGYIGERTRVEIDYATKLGKPIQYLESLQQKGEKLP